MKSSKQTELGPPPAMVKRLDSPPIRSRWSQRKYPEKQCGNPLCQYGGVFRPHDKRQMYCCRQCGTDHRNDLRAEANRTKYSDEKKLRLTDRQLGLLYAEHFDGKQCAVHSSVFRLNKVDIRYSITSDHTKGADNKINWLYEYGLMRDLDNREYLFIIKRKNQNI
jgi:hypothetical protein